MKTRTNQKLLKWKLILFNYLKFNYIRHVNGMIEEREIHKAYGIKNYHENVDIFKILS